MTADVQPNPRILGTLRIEDGVGIVRVEDSFDTDINDLWSAVTDPSRLSRWLCDVEGDRRVGGVIRLHFHGTGWEGASTIQACEAPNHFKLTGKDEGLDYESVTEVWLVAEGDKTRLIREGRGMPTNMLAAYGAGMQAEIEDLATYLAGRERGDSEARWHELAPAYAELAKDIH
jgi:uncharacterized protein YndB with AHSA1/START domain